MLAKRSGRWNGYSASERRDDRKGAMPFALVAVLLLMVSSISIVIIFSFDHSREGSRLPAETIQKMKVAAAAASEDVKRSAYAAALEAIRETRDLDEISLLQRFREAFSAALNESYPDHSGRFRIAVHQENVTLAFMEASLEDAYVIYGQDEALAGRVSLPAFFALSGSFVLNVSNHQGRILYGQDIDQDIYLPLPFLFDRLARLQVSAAPLGDLESMVRYMLSALAQERVLMGYGMAAKTGEWSTEAIVTEEDVVRAVNLALVLEQLRIFRSASDAALAEFPELEDLLEDGRSYDGLDPADLFLSIYGDDEINLAPLVSQAIRVLADRMLFSYLEYYGIIDLVNFGEDVVEAFVWGARDLADFITGGDGAQDDIEKYITKAMDDAGYFVWWYREWNAGGAHVLIELPAREIYFSDDNGNGFWRTFQGTYGLDFPQIDILESEAWGDFYRDYVSSTHQMVGLLRGFVATLADMVAAHADLPLIDLDLDPTDGRGFMEQITSQLSRAFKNNPDWLKPAMDQARGIEKVRDDLAQAALDFIERQWMELFRMNYSIKYAATELSKVLINQLDGTPDFSEERKERSRLLLENLLLDDSWAYDLIHDGFNYLAGHVLEMFRDALSKKNDSGTVQDLIVKGLAIGFGGLPNVEEIISACMMKTVKDMNTAARLWGGEMQVPVGQDGFQLVSRNGVERTEQLVVGSDLLSLYNGGTGGLAVEITRPWDFDREDDAYPHRHVTDLGSLTFSPYLTQWDISYQGSVRVTLNVPASNFDGVAIADIPCTLDITIAGQFSVVTNSAWSLNGVEYRPTTTLAEDIVKFLTKAWEFLVSGAQTIAGVAFKAFTIFAQLLSVTVTAAARPLEMLSDLLMKGVEALGDLITGVLSDIIGAIADLTRTVAGGTTIRLSLLGITSTLTISPDDSKLAGTEDQIKLGISFSLLGTDVSATLRVLQLSDGSRTLLGNVAMSRDDWRMELVMDPLNKIYQHKVEARGYFGDKAIELVLPEVQREQKVSVKLSDVPGLGALLKLIPSPVPGAKFHIDGGIEVCFNLLSRGTVMINEFEADPAGSDANREKVELFNPTDKAIDLSGWSLVTSHGKITTVVLSDVIIPARGHYVHTFSGQALDNGGAEGFPLQDSLALLDPSGARVDSAPWTMDNGNDGRTWQRAYDGSSTWEFRQGTIGSSNGGVLFRDMDTGSLTSMLTWSFRSAFEGMTSAIPDAQTVEDLFRAALSALREKILDAVGDAVSWVEISIQLGLDDYSGSLGAGLSVGLLADGKGVRECFAWAADSVGEMLRDPLNPLAAVQRAPVPVDALADHVFIQYKAYVSVGLPDIVEAVSGDTSTKGAVVLQWSLGNLGIGSSGGTINFFLVISDLPGPRIKAGMFSASDSVSVWMLKGKISRA